MDRETRWKNSTAPVGNVIQRQLVYARTWLTRLILRLRRPFDPKLSTDILPRSLTQKQKILSLNSSCECLVLCNVTSFLCALPARQHSTIIGDELLHGSLLCPEWEGKSKTTTFRLHNRRIRKSSASGRFTFRICLFADRGIRLLVFVRQIIVVSLCLKYELCDAMAPIVLRIDVIDADHKKDEEIMKRANSWKVYNASNQFHEKFFFCRFCVLLLLSAGGNRLALGW